MRRLTVILLAALALTACNRKAEDTLDDAALQAVSEQATADLNDAGAAIVALVKSVDKPSPIGPEALMISLDQKSAMVDWWLLRHNIIQPIQPIQDVSRPTYLALPDAIRALSSASTDWFEAGAGTAENVDCQTPQALEAQGCEADVTLTLSLTPEGQTILGQGQVLQPLKVHVLLARAGEGWEVRSMRGPDGITVHDFVLNLLLGDEEQRDAARQATLASLSAQSAVNLSAPTPDAFAVGADPTPPPLNITPVEPVQGDNPLAPPPRRPAAPPVP